MATYGSKYKTTWYDNFGRANIIRIRELDFAGSEETIQAMAVPAWYDLNSASELDPYQSPMRGSTISVFLKDATGFKYLAMMQAASKQYMVQWTIDAVEFWSGWVAQGSYQQPYTLAPYGVEIKCTDGLATLRRYDFGLTGKQTILSIVSHALSKIQDDSYAPLYIYENVNKYETNHDKGNADSPLDQTYIDCDDMFYDEDGRASNCYDAVFEALWGWGVELRLIGDGWHILQINISHTEYRRRKYDIIGGSHSYDSNELFDPTMNTTSGTVGLGTMNTLVIDGNLSSLPGFKKFKINQDFVKRGADSLLLNSELSEFITSTQLEDWTNHGGTTYEKREEGIVFTGDIIHGSNASKFISQAVTIDDADSEQRLNIKIKHRSLANGPGAKWAYAVGVGPTPTTKQWWSAGSVNWTLSVAPIQNVIDIPEGDLTTDNPVSGELNIETDAIPIAGELEIRVYQDYGAGVLEVLYVQEINLNIFEDDFTYEKDYLFEVDLGEDHYMDEEYPISIGDAPIRTISDPTTQPENLGLLYKGILYYLDSGTYYTTAEWDYGDPSGRDDQLLLQKLISEISALRQRARTRIATDLVSKAYRPNRVLVDQSNTELQGDHYRLNHGRYNGLTGIWSVQLIEAVIVQELATKAGVLITTKDGQTIQIK